MQPVHVEPRGSFCSTIRRFTPESSQSTIHLVFNDAGDAACLFDSHRLECYHGSKVWSKTFSWSVASDLKQTDLKDLGDGTKSKVNQDIDSWSIGSVRFIPTATNRHITSSSSYPLPNALLVVLINSVKNITWLCHFPNINEKRHNTGLYLHGLVSVSEWIPSRVAGDHSFMSPTESEPPTMLLDRSDNSMNSNVLQKLASTSNVSDGCRGCLAVGLRQGLVGIVVPFPDLPSDSCLRGRTYSNEPVWAMAVEKSHFLSMLSRELSNSVDLDESALTYLDAAAVRWNEFQYKSVNGRVLANFPALSVYVSALRFIPNSQTLIVGYSFGGWQIWSMRTLTLEFSLRHTSVCAPVVQIAFQEPSDDPRYCCYIWIGWQSCEDSTTGDQISAQAKLYQLHYKKRFEEPGVIPGEVSYSYQSLVGLSERLGTELFTAHLDRKPPENQLLRIQPIRTGPSSSMATTNQSDAAHLVTLMWSVSPGVVRVGLFDLDRWYHAQMPTQIRPDNSFFAVVDVPLPDEKAVALHGHLLEHTMESFWSRIASRERQLDALHEPLPAFDSRSSSFPCTPVSPAVASTTSATIVRRPVPRPVPEVCLRPSALSFSILVAWVTPENSSDNGGGFLLAHYASRQEACLLSLTTAISMATDKRFILTDWLSEAWATGLLESPGLDVIEEEDLERLFHLSHQLDDRASGPNRAPSDVDLVGLRLAYGEGLEMNLVHTMEDILSISCDPSELDFPTSKRPRIAGAVSSSEVPYDTAVGTILSPAWVLLANCLLEHGHIAPLKSIEQLAKGYGSTSPANPRFRQYWLWLRFQRLKARFDQLTGPLFSPIADVSSEDSRNLTAVDKEDALGLGATACQIQQLATLAQHWFPDDQLPKRDSQKKQPTLRSKAKASLWSAVATYASYTRLVLFLCRLGLLPQHASISEAVIESSLEDFLTDLDKTSKSLLLPYAPELLNHVINELRERGGLDADTELPLTKTLLHTCLGWLPYNSTAAITDELRIWYEQEGSNHSGRAAPQPFYPPKRLQSLCALWQLGQTDFTRNRSFLGLLGFVLCDATATTASARQMQTLNGHANANILAVHLCRHVLSLYAKEFPSVRPLLPTVFTLWLLDRACFKEVKITPLRAYVTGSTRNPWEDGQLLSLFPNQSAILEDYLRRHKQFDLCRQLIPTSVGSQSVTSIYRSELHSKLDRTCEAKLSDFRPTGAPFLALARFRRMVQKFHCLKDSNVSNENLIERMEDALQNVFVQIAEACRHVGRLGDLVNLGLTVWEAQTLVDFYLSSRQYGVLFYCLVARKQYKNALGIYDQYLSMRRKSGMVVNPSVARLASKSDASLAVVSKLLASAVPEFHEDPCDHWSDFANRQPLVDALAHPFVALEPAATNISPPGPVSYRSDAALRCPLTVAKPKGPRRLYNSERAGAIFTVGGGGSSPFDSDDDTQREDVIRAVRSPVSRSTTDTDRVRTEKLLETAKKSSSEFWDTFRELENLQRSCNLSFDLSSLIKSQLETSLTQNSRSSMAAGRPSLWHPGVSDRSGKDNNLFKLIYTPPTNRFGKRADSVRQVSPHRSTLAARRSCHTPRADHHTPISILKSSFSRTPVTDGTSFDLTDRNLNETLACDDDVKLNLSTVRPSLSCASTLNAAPIVTTTEFTFSAPRRISARPKLSSIRSSVIEEKPSFHFATPLSPRSEHVPSCDTHRTVTETVRSNVPEPDKLNAGSDTVRHPYEVPSPIKDQESGNERDKFEINSAHALATGVPISPRKPLDACRVRTNGEHRRETEEQSVPEVPSVATRVDDDSNVKHLTAGSMDDSTMDMDDTVSVTSFMSQDNDASSFSSETPRRSSRRVRPPKRYDPSAFH